MATSGTTTFNLDIDDVIEDAVIIEDDKDKTDETSI